MSCTRAAVLSWLPACCSELDFRTQKALPTLANPLHRSWQARLQVSVGDAGYFADPPATKEAVAEALSPVCCNPLDNGTYGVDFVRNLGDPNIAFGTLDLCAGPLHCTSWPQPLCCKPAVLRLWQGMHPCCCDNDASRSAQAGAAAQAAPLLGAKMMPS